MSRDINHITVEGNLGREPESRNTRNGAIIVGLVVATKRSWKRPSDTDWTEETEWHRITVMGDNLTALAKQFAKGQRVHIEGRIQTRKWQDQEGKDRWTTEIIAAGKDAVVRGIEREPQQAQQSQRPLADELDDEIPF